MRDDTLTQGSVLFPEHQKARHTPDSALHQAVDPEQPPAPAHALPPPEQRNTPAIRATCAAAAGSAEGGYSRSIRLQQRQRRRRRRGPGQGAAVAGGE